MPNEPEAKARPTLDKLRHLRRVSIAAAPKMVFDFQRLFDASPNLYLILDRDLNIAGANKAYLASVKRELSDIVGRWAWEAFPTDAETERQAVASFQRVIATGKPDVMALLRFDTPRPEAEGGGFDEHHWTITHTPVFDDAGAVAYVLQNPVEVTELKQLREAVEAAGLSSVPALHPAQTHIFDRAQQVFETNLTLLAERNRLEQMFEQAPSFMAMLSGPEHVFEFVNPSYLRLIGQRDVVGKPVREALPDAATQGYADLLDRVYASGEAFSSSAARYDVQAEPGGAVVERFVDFVFQPLRGMSGDVTGIFIDGTDVSDRVKAEAQREILTKELSHRMKNMLAMVQAVATQTLRQVTERKAVDAFTQRLHALSAANEVLLQKAWASARIKDVVTKVLSTFEGSDRFDVAGPALTLGPRATLSLSLLLHELGTNAVKYGALSNAEGRVAVTWQVEAGEDDPQVVVGWRETCGPPVQAPAARGFGSRLIQMGLVGTGGTTLRYDFEGLVVEMRALLSQLQQS